MDKYYISNITSDRAYTNWWSNFAESISSSIDTTDNYADNDSYARDWIAIRDASLAQYNAIFHTAKNTDTDISFLTFETERDATIFFIKFA